MTKFFGWVSIIRTRGGATLLLRCIVLSADISPVLNKNGIPCPGTLGNGVLCLVWARATAVHVQIREMRVGRRQDRCRWMRGRRRGSVAVRKAWGGVQAPYPHPKLSASGMGSTHPHHHQSPYRGVTGASLVMFRVWGHLEVCSWPSVLARGEDGQERRRGEERGKREFPSPSRYRQIRGTPPRRY